MKSFIILFVSTIVLLSQNGMASEIPQVDGCPPQNGKPIPR